MFLTLWNYLRGYVIVEVSGFSMERFINLAVNNNIYLWDIQEKDHKIYFKTGIEDFKRLKPHAKKARCRFKAKYKKGFPFVAYKYKKRKMLTIGSVLFILMIWMLASFVWLVEVEGNERISSLDIITSLEAKGYSAGKLKTKLNLREAETYLINQYPDIVWAGIKFEGTRLLVQIAEIVPKPQMNDENVPCNIIAKRDALITYIATYKGMPLVKKGDTVKKGDVLVAGQMPLGIDDPNMYFTASRANIKGKTTYYMQGEASIQQMSKDYTDHVSRKYSLKLFNKLIPFLNQKVSFEYYDRVITTNQLRITKLFPLPFAFEVEERLEYVPVITEITEQDAKDQLLARLWEDLSKNLSDTAIILKRDVFFSKTGNAISAILSVIAEEDIGYAVELQNEGEN
ncbi:sporulation protein YqfD [Cellulosilyticum sp. I15G10I2]|uniref:sporulation protein YqfD n=1 Tax=Cellulosilyticum sp. I15G10I2 TaxID=1892843 RepID=UPI00085C7669|nr:sporulation protein YqfD [Cellulosilyticum sp. I15G10I2]